MTKANIQLSNGTKITVDGSPEEVAKAIRLMQGGPGNYSKESSSRAKSTKRAAASRKTGVIGRVRELIADGFFKEQKTLQEVKTGLSEKGHIYPITSLSPAVIRLVRSRELRRIRHDKSWTYVGA